MPRIIIISAIIALIIFVSACSKNKAESPIDSPQMEDATAQTPSAGSGLTSAQAAAAEVGDYAATQSNHFSFKLFRELNHKPGNIFFSPYSINAALGMTYSGAKGATADEIAEVMGYSQSPDDQHRILGKNQADLLSYAEKNPLELNVANAIFSAAPNAPYLKRGYINLLRESFAAELFNLDFSKAQESSDFINEFVSKATNDRIRDMMTKAKLEKIGDGIVLINAVYFKADWLQKFSPKDTREDRFYLDPNRQKTMMIDMMHQKARFGYGKIPGYEILEMPYAAEDMSMVMILPERMETLEKELDEELFDKLMDALKIQETRVFIPRFRMEESLDALGDSFQSLGMRSAFDPDLADFSGIMSVDKARNLYISSISHKAFLEVKEEGSEAAAATDVSFAVTSFQPPSEIPVFRADRAFVLMIIHRPSRQILFMGKLIEPAPAD